MSFRSAIPCILALLGMAATCAHQGSQVSRNLAGLSGKKVGVASLSAVSTLELRYLLHQAHGLDTSQKTSQVAFVEVPEASLAGLLDGGQIDAALLPPEAAYARDSAGDRGISHVSRAVDGAAGGPVAGSVLVSYPDVVEAKPAAIDELDHLLAQSVAYAGANRSLVSQAVASAQDWDAGFVRWQAEHERLPLGDVSMRLKQDITRTLRMAAAVGDIGSVPDVSGALFDRARPSAASATGNGHMTISLALLDDPAHRAALYAIEQGIATSPKIDVNVTYLSPVALEEAAIARQYDVIEASPLVLVTGPLAGISFIAASAGVEDSDSTLLFLGQAARLGTATPRLTVPAATPTIAPTSASSPQGGAR